MQRAGRLERNGGREQHGLDLLEQAHLAPKAAPLIVGLARVHGVVERAASWGVGLVGAHVGVPLQMGFSCGVLGRERAQHAPVRAAALARQQALREAEAYGPGRRARPRADEGQMGELVHEVAAVVTNPRSAPASVARQVVSLMGAAVMRMYHESLSDDAFDQQLLVEMLYALDVLPQDSQTAPVDVKTLAYYFDTDREGSDGTWARVARAWRPPAAPRAGAADCS